MSTLDEQKLNQFVDTVCSYITCREVHPGIVTELRGHLDDRVQGYTDQGLPHSEAIDRALKDMGSPVTIGCGLHRAHRPHTDWLFVAMVAVYIGVTVITIFSLNGSRSINVNMTYDALFARKVLCLLIGLSLAAGATLIDYRRFRQISTHLLFATGAIVVFTVLFGHDRFGGQDVLHVWGMRIDVMGVVPVLLLIALTGMMGRFDIDRRKDFLQLVALFMIPMWLFIKNHEWDSLEYAVGFLALMIVTPSIRKHRGVMLGAIAVVITYIIATLGHLRIGAYLHPKSYPASYAYQYLQGRQMMNSAGWWGHGLHSPLPLVPGLQDVMALDYVIYAFGWLSGLAMVALMVALLARMIWISRKTHDEYGQTLVTALGTLVVVQFLYPILMTFGVLPTVGPGIPLLGTDGSVSMTELACLGVILSVYRRRNMIPTAVCNHRQIRG